MGYEYNLGGKAGRTFGSRDRQHWPYRLLVLSMEEKIVRCRK